MTAILNKLETVAIRCLPYAFAAGLAFAGGWCDGIADGMLSSGLCVAAFVVAVVALLNETEGR